MRTYKVYECEETKRTYTIWMTPISRIHWIDQVGYLRVGYLKVVDDVHGRRSFIIEWGNSSNRFRWLHCLNWMRPHCHNTQIFLPHFSIVCARHFFHTFPRFTQFLFHIYNLDCWKADSGDSFILVYVDSEALIQIKWRVFLKSCVLRFIKLNLHGWFLDVLYKTY